MSKFKQACHPESQFIVLGIPAAKHFREGCRFNKKTFEQDWIAYEKAGEEQTSIQSRYGITVINPDHMWEKIATSASDPCHFGDDRYQYENMAHLIHQASVYTTGLCHIDQIALAIPLGEPTRTDPMTRMLANYHVPPDAPIYKYNGLLFFLIGFGAYNVRQLRSSLNFPIENI